MTTTTTTRRPAREISPAAAERIRATEWQGAMDLADGTEYAEGYTLAGRPCRLYRKLGGHTRYYLEIEN